MSDTTTTRRRRFRGVRPLAALLLALLGLLTVLTACSSDDGGSDGGTRVVKTEKGDVTVPAEPKRIVSLAASLSGYLFTLDAPVAATDTRVLGVTNLDGGFPPAWSVKAKAQGTTELPAGEELNLDAITKAQPDLIIAGGQGISAVQAEKLYDQLSKIAPTVYISPKVTNWQDQLKQVAEATGRSDKVDGLLKTYEDKVTAVKDAITVPGNPTAYFLSLSTNEPALIPQTAALPTLLTRVGFQADDVMKKANNPELYGSGDSFIFSNELLSKAADAPVLFVLPVAGRTLEQLKADPLYAALPAFKNNKVYELPATSYRADYDGVMDTLDRIQKLFAK